MALSSLGLLIIGSIPTVIGVAEAIDAQKKQNQQAKERIKFHLTAKFSIDGKSPVQQATVVFSNDKVSGTLSLPPCVDGTLPLHPHLGPSRDEWHS